MMKIVFVYIEGIIHFPLYPIFSFILYKFYRRYGWHSVRISPLTTRVVRLLWFYSYNFISRLWSMLSHLSYCFNLFHFRLLKKPHTPGFLCCHFNPVHLTNFTSMVWRISTENRLATVDQNSKHLTDHTNQLFESR